MLSDSYFCHHGYQRAYSNNLRTRAEGYSRARPCVNLLFFSTSLTRRYLSSTQEHDIKNLFGRKVAIDASMSIYQFLIAVRQKDGELLTNDAGETTRCG